MIAEKKMKGYLTTHVLDTARGAPASGLRVVLFKIEQNDRVQMADITTNADGRTDAPILPSDRFEAGVYELIFHAGDYLVAESGVETKALFLDQIPIRFSMTEDSHYHVPLLLSPFGYSTYRGS